MSNRAVKFAVVCGAACVLGVQLWVKPRPSAEDINRWARNARETAAWRDRIAPDFELTLLDGSTFRLADRIGRDVVILNFFATWCGPCRAEMPELQRYAEAHKSDGLLLLAIDAEEKHTVVEQFVRELELTFPVGIDGSGDLLTLYGVTSFPTTVVIGADGRVKLYETGAISNADVAFGPVVTPELTAVRDGRGVSLEGYRAALAAAPPPQTEPGAVAPLTGRARKIAEAMPCPCGCDDKVHECGCSTSKGIKARLAKGVFDDKTDAEVMEELNKEFCMKDM